MVITDTDIVHIAHLARLEISNHDIAAYTQDMANILQLVAQMNQIDTGAVAPLVGSLETAQCLREDCVTEANLRETLQQLAPQVANGYYLVPKVIDEE